MAARNRNLNRQSAQYSTKQLAIRHSSDAAPFIKGLSAAPMDHLGNGVFGVTLFHNPRL
jgi:hypothetical protein